MSSDKSALCEIRVLQGQQENVFYLHTVLTDQGHGGISLGLTDAEDVWEGRLSEDDLDLLRARLKMDFKAYVEQTVAALTRDKTKNMSFEYQLKALPSHRMQLVWKKCVPGEEIKIQLGSISLEKSDNPLNQIRNIFAECVSSMSDLHSHIQDLESSCERLAQERQNAVKRLDKCVSAKEELEQDLYAKFAAVLNSKKERIRQLEEGIPESFSAEANGSPEPGPSTSKATYVSAGDGPDVTPKRKNDRSEYSVDTDTESQESKPPIKQARKTAKSQLDDSSLNLGDDEDEKTAAGVAPAARRPRRQQPVKKQTPSKPVLPKASTGKEVSDSSRPGSANRRTSLRKSGSMSSSKSSVDPDDLLDEM